MLGCAPLCYLTEYRNFPLMLFTPFFVMRFTGKAAVGGFAALRWRRPVSDGASAVESIPMTQEPVTTMVRTVASCEPSRSARHVGSL